jgi:hypothetical protein
MDLVAERARVEDDGVCYFLVRLTPTVTETAQDSQHANFPVNSKAKILTDRASEIAVRRTFLSLQNSMLGSLTTIECE